MSNFSVQTFESGYLNVESLFLSTGWDLVSGVLRHSSSKTTSVSKTYTELEIGITYRISFTIANYQSCSLILKVGSYTSAPYTANGTYNITTTLAGSNLVSFIGNGYFDVTNFSVNTDLISYSPVDYDNSDIFENKSFTVSFNPIGEKWISYHSYIPKIYIPHPNKYLLYDGSIKIAHADNHNLKFILETVFNENPLYTKAFDSISINSEAFEDEEHVNKFFSNMVVYNDDQISGDIPLNSSTLIRKERDWNINKFTDISNQSGKQKLFSTAWVDKKNNYFIDKSINNSAININKEWYKRGRFRNKYLVVRFIDNNLDNKNFIVNFVNTVYRLSQR